MHYRNPSPTLCLTHTHPIHSSTHPPTHSWPQCEDTTTIVTVVKGDLWTLPCHYEHKHRKSWHWKPKPKREWKGEACKCE